MAAQTTINSPADYTGRDGGIDHALKLEKTVPPDLNGRMLYASSNGDKWYLIRDSQGVAVVHVPNVPSGGQVARIDVGEFLVRGNGGPERQELLRLIGTLVDGE
jgi:hypothetical protein